jgi:cyclic-di-GMP-binding protein
VENVSDGGYGAIIPEVKGDWIQLGTLLGVRTETAPTWGAGVIRRLTCDDFRQRCVGIQVLSPTAIPVTLSPAATASSFSAMREGDPAVLLSTAPDKNDEIGLLLKVGSFTPGQAIEMNVRGRNYHLISGKLLEGGDDFDWARYKVITTGR